MSDELKAKPSFRWPLLAHRLSPFTSHPSLLAFLFSLLLAFLATGPLLSNPGFLSTRGIGDAPNLLFRLHQLLAAWAGGEFPARWMPDAAYGYGLPYFTYYASLSTHIAALFKLYGFSYVLALKLTQLAALMAAAGGLYAWAQSVGLTPAQSLLASAAYTFAPFHLVNLYARGDSLAELWAMSLFPVALWMVERGIQRSTWARWLSVAMVVAALICTHNISALNFLPFLGLYALLRSARDLRRVAVAGGALLWGLALAAFFWWPALAEGGAVQLGGLTQGYFHYSQHFRAADLIQRAWVFSFDTNPFSMGLAQTLGTALGVGLMLWRAAHARRWTALDSFLVLGLALTTLLITPLSRPLWDNAPLLRYTQFPWRFLSIQALFTAMFTAAIIPPRLTRAALWAALLSLTLAGTALGGLRPEFIPLMDADVTAARLNLYEYFSTAIGNTVNAEYLPRAVQPRPFTSAAMLGRSPALKTLNGTAIGAQDWKRGTTEQWTVIVSSDSATLAVPTFYWPGWQAELDGRPLPVRPADSLGWLTVDVPRGQHTLCLHLGRTPLRAAAETVSLLAWVVSLVILVWRNRDWRIRDWRIGLLRLAPWGLAFGFLILGFGIFGSVLLRLAPTTSHTAPLSMDFDTLPYPFRDAVRFEGGFALTRVDYSSETAMRGETLIVQTEWEATQAGTARFSLASPASHLADAPTVLASAVAPIAPPTAEQTLTFTLPADIPPGAYFITVEVDTADGPRRALTSSGRARGLVHLAPIVIDGPEVSAPDMTLAQFGPAIQLAQLSAEARAGVLHLALQWRALADVPRNYLLAVRLRDASGAEWAALDTQPGNEFYPTALWRAGEVIPDSYALPLPVGMPPAAYSLSLSVYDPLTLEALGEVWMQTIALSAASPIGARTAQFMLTPELGLERVDFPSPVTQGDAPELAAHWLAFAAPPHNYRARWSFVNAAGLEFAAQTLGLAAGSESTQWPAPSYVLGRARLPIAQELPPGDYALTLQLMSGDERVGQAHTVARVSVLGRARNFAVPPLQTDVRATFGEALMLWGYDATQTADALTLTLVWGALDTPGRDYKFFVHLFNPADESVPAQADAMPRDFTYPTGLWVKREVVTDTVTLDLRGVPPGEYRVAVGWYDPAAPENRLPALDASGGHLDFDRVVLPVRVTVP